MKYHEKAKTNLQQRRFIQENKKIGITSFIRPYSLNHQCDTLRHAQSIAKKPLCLHF